VTAQWIFFQSRSRLGRQLSVANRSWPGRGVQRGTRSRIIPFEMWAHPAGRRPDGSCLTGKATNLDVLNYRYSLTDVARSKGQSLLPYGLIARSAYHVGAGRTANAVAQSNVSHAH